jgi:hypothetical protein
MAEPAAELARRDPSALDKIVGTGDTRAMLEQVERNVRDVIDIARDRGFVTRFNNRDFFGFPAWSLLAMTYGLVPFVEWTKPVEGGWEARAVVRTREGDVVAAAEAMCTRKEAPRRSADDHTLRAMAQTRAMRNALRSCLGAALVMAGFDFSDPEGPATKEQIGVLHQLERELGWTHEEGHAAAGEVDSFKELNREEASVLIDRWTALRDEKSGGATETDTSPETGAPGVEASVDNAAYGEGVAVSTPASPGAPPPEDSTLDEPAPPSQWEVAGKRGLTAGKALARAKKKPWGKDYTSATQITKRQLSELVEDTYG